MNKGTEDGQAEGKGINRQTKNLPIDRGIADGQKKK